MKQAVLNLMRMTGAFAPFRLANRTRPLILTYHRFSRYDDRNATAEGAFAEQLNYLSARYCFVPLSLIVDRLASGMDLPPRAVAITIDDGYHDSYDIAFPLLRQYQAPATIFVVTDFIDRRAWLWPDKLRFAALKARAGLYDLKLPNGTLQLELRDRPSRLEAANRVNALLKLLPHSLMQNSVAEITELFGVQMPELPPREWSALSWDQIQEMETAGIRAESHTLSHPILTNSSDEQLGRELLHSRLRLETVLGRRADLFCYPNGDYDERVQRAVVRAGYRCAVSTDCGLVDRASHLLALRRVHAERDPAHFMQATSGFEQWKQKVWRNHLGTPDKHRFRRLGKFTQAKGVGI